MKKIVYVKVKPCPFCGWKEVKLQCRPDKHFDFPNRLKCCGCGATTGWYMTGEAACDSWNTRIKA